MKEGRHLKGLHVIKECYLLPPVSVSVRRDLQLVARGSDPDHPRWE